MERDNVVRYLIAAAVGAALYAWFWVPGQMAEAGQRSDGRVAAVEEQRDEARGYLTRTCETASEAALDSGHYTDTPGTAWFWNWWGEKCGWIDHRGP